MTAVEFKNKIDSIIFAETPEMQSKLLKKLYKTMILKEEPQQEFHICKYCGVETTQPDDECYAKPQKTNSMTAVEWLVQQICGEQTDAWKKEIEKAKEIEKQQIIAAVEWNYKSNMGEVYYNALYKNEQI